MDPAVRKAVEHLESRFGSKAVLQILQDGLSAYGKRLEDLTHALTDENGELARRVSEIARSIDPDIALRFQRTESRLCITAVGKLTPDTAERLNTEFEKLRNSVPGLAEVVPELKTVIKLEKVKPEDTDG